MNIDLEKLNEDKKKNLKERMNFIKFWAEYVKTHTDKEWSKQQNVIIDSQITRIKKMVGKE